MIDREKVLNGLRCLSDANCTEKDCDNCKYDFASCVLDVSNDALQLLKEHEAVKPIFIQTTRTREGGLMEVSIKCGNCKSKVQYYPERWKYCPNCSREVKWDDRA